MQLISQLEGIEAGKTFQGEHRRRRHLLEDLEQHHRLVASRKVVIATADDVHERLLRDLPLGVQLKPGGPRIEFFGTEDLLRHLYGLGAN